jgi:tetratricopeptide (TPR) repeat protein
MSGDLRRPQRHGIGRLRLRTLAAIYRVQSRWELATEALERSGALFGEVGDEHRRAITLTYRASVLRHEGRPAEGFRLLDDAIAIFTRLNFPLWLAIAQVHRANCLGDVGAYDEAVTLLDNCRQQFSQMGESRWSTIARLHQCRLVLNRRDVAAGSGIVAELEEIESEFDTLGDIYSMAVASWIMSATLREDGQPDAARRAARRALGHFTTLGNERMRDEIVSVLDR